MKKKLDVIGNIIVPTLVGYATFFLILSLYQKLFFEYRWLAIIPFVIVTAFFIKDNISEWKVIKQEG